MSTTGFPSTTNADLTTPAVNAEAVTPSDTVNFALGTARALYVGTTGNIALQLLSGQTVIFSNVPAGVLLPMICTRVNATNTNASNMVAMS